MSIMNFGSRIAACFHLRSYLLSQGESVENQVDFKKMVYLMSY